LASAQSCGKIGKSGGALSITTTAIESLQKDRLSGKS
jgi:hypothetical protein